LKISRNGKLPKTAWPPANGLNRIPQPGQVILPFADSSAQTGKTREHQSARTPAGQLTERRLHGFHWLGGRFMVFNKGKQL